MEEATAAWSNVEFRLAANKNRVNWCMVVPSPIQLSLGWQLKFPSYDSQQESCSCTGHFTSCGDIAELTFWVYPHAHVIIKQAKEALEVCAKPGSATGMNYKQRTSYHPL